MGRGGGGGGLRILGHKSWNVYGYEQKQRVKADEAKHAEETRASREATQRAEAEFRIGLLRDRARKRAAAAGAEGEGEQYDEEEERQRHHLSPNGLEDADGGAASSGPASKRQRLSPGSSKRPVRFVVQQEEEGAAAASASASAAAGSSTAAEPADGAPVERFTLFDEATLGSSQQSAAMVRLRADEARAAELKHMRAHAPVSMFVNAFRDEKGNDALRPWYARGEGERQAAELRQTEVHKRQVVVRSRTDGSRGVRLSLNTTGLPVHSVADPLDEVRENLRRLDRHEAAKDGGREEQEQRLHDPDAQGQATGSNDSAGLVQQAIAQAKLQAATAHLQQQQQQQLQQQQLEASPSSSSVTPPVPPMHRSLSAASSSSLSDMPALQPASMWSSLSHQPPSPGSAVSAAPSSAAAGVAGAAGARRSRWDAAEPQSPLHYSSRVGFTNAASALMPNAVMESAPAPPPLFASAAAAVAVRSRTRSPSHSSSSSSESSSSSDSDSDDDGGDRDRRRRRSSKRRRSRERSSDRGKSSSSSSKKKKHKEKKKESKKSKKHKRKRSRGRSSERGQSKVRTGASATGTSAAPLPSLLSSASSSRFAGVVLKSSAELRAERQDRERAERDKAAALLGVPAWATAHPNSVLQRSLKDEATGPSSRRRQHDEFQGRHPSEFAYNRRS